MKRDDSVPPWKCPRCERLVYVSENQHAYVCPIYRVMIDKRYYRPDELAAILEEPVRTVQHWLQTGRIRGERIGRRWHIPRDEVERVRLEAARTTPPRRGSRGSARNSPYSSSSSSRT